LPSVSRAGFNNAGSVRLRKPPPRFRNPMNPDARPGRPHHAQSSQDRRPWLRGFPPEGTGTVGRHPASARPALVCPRLRACDRAWRPVAPGPQRRPDPLHRAELRSVQHECWRTEGRTEPTRTPVGRGNQPTPMVTQDYDEVCRALR